MIWFLVLIGAVLVFAPTMFALCKRSGDPTSAALAATTFLSLFIAFFGFLVAGALAFVVGIFVPQPTALVTVPLTSLQDGSSVHGSFFLGSGTIDEKQYYSYYAWDNNTQSYRLYKIEARDAGIRYDDNPRLEYKTGPACGWWSCYSNEKMDYIFYVPKGSIVNDYTLDAK